MTYADNYSIRGPSLSGANIGNALDGLLTNVQEVHGTSAINTTSGSFVDYTSASLSISTATGEMLLLLGQIDVSHGTDGNYILGCFGYDAVDQVANYWSASQSSTSGLRGTLTMMHLVTAPSVAAHTIKIRWATNGGTAYSTNYRLYAFAFQNS